MDDAVRTERLRPALKEAALLLLVFLLLFFRNWRIFIFPEPWAEDMAVFLRDEYSTGFPGTAFSLYAGYLHLLPRLIAWLSLKAGLPHAMLVMSWSVLFIKLLACALIYRSKEITSPLMKGSIIAYLVLMPFVSEIYNNVTNLQWWLIPLMAVIILRHKTSAASLAFSAITILLTGLTGVNSVMFALPCAYLMAKERTPASVIKNSIVILCALVQFYFLCTTGRSGNGRTVYEGGITGLICIFVQRVIFHTLFKSAAPPIVSIPVFALFLAALALKLRHYRNLLTVRFLSLFAAAYAAVILYSILKTEKDASVLITGFAGERYFVFLRLCTFALLVSSLDLLFSSRHLRRNYRKLMAASCIALALVLVRRYPVSFPSGSPYYADLERLEAAKSGDLVTIHFPPGWKCDLRKK